MYQDGVKRKQQCQKSEKRINLHLISQIFHDQSEMCNIQIMTL